MCSNVKYFGKHLVNGDLAPRMLASEPVLTALHVTARLNISTKFAEPRLLVPKLTHLTNIYGAPAVC